MKKKIIITVIGLVFIVSLFVVYSIFKKEEDTSLTKIRLAEVTHSPFYAPLYVAIEEGYMEEEGIDIELLLTPGADKVAAAVLSGDVEVGFAGEESAMPAVRHQCYVEPPSVHVHHKQLSEIQHIRHGFRLRAPCICMASRLR